MSKKANQEGSPSTHPHLNPPLEGEGIKAAGEGAMAEVDEHHGMGGSYVLDPGTGKRILQERTLEATASATETKE